jgi:DNA-binding NtrC family response regulator
MDLTAVKQRFGIIGNAAALNHALSTAVQVAPTDITVLITGESGVGKEVFSKILHQLSRRKHGKFIAVNCGAIPEGTIDSELFGHEKGSFTGAFEARQGYFETVNGGTIFLDELAEMPLGTQARLLRLLESGEFIKVGSSKVQKTDVRVITATNVDLHAQIQKGRFREDLYYRLNTVAIQIPALRERPGDIPLLFRRFAVDFAERYSSPPIQIDADAQEILTRYRWPGNIRQLKNVAEQISVLAPHRLVQGDEVRRYLPAESNNRSLPMTLGLPMGSDEMSERDLLYKVLFDMKKDIVELKQVVARLMHTAADSVMDMPNRPQFDVASAWDRQEAVMRPAETDGPAGTTEILTHPMQRRMVFEDQPAVEDIEENLSLEEVERKMIDKALRKHDGKRRNAALELGISERTLYRKLKEYGMEEV